MARFARAAACGLLLLSGAGATDFMATADSFASTASSNLDKASSALTSGMEKAKTHYAKAKGFADKVEDVLCKMPGLSTMNSCKQAAPAAASDGACVGPECCAMSSCMSNSIPGLKCDGNRGTTTCVGTSILSGREGVCRCASGPCSAQGKCQDSMLVSGTPAPTAAWAASSAPAAGGYGTIQRFDSSVAPERVPQERLVRPFAAYVGFVGLLVMVAGRALWTLRAGTRRSVIVEEVEENFLE